MSTAARYENKVRRKALSVRRWGKDEGEVAVTLEG